MAELCRDLVGEMRSAVDQHEPLPFSQDARDIVRQCALSMDNKYPKDHDV
jgi:hypothetical protein